MGAVAPGAGLGFSGSLLGSTTFGPQGNVLHSELYYNAPNGNGFTLPGSFELVVLGEGYTWNPGVVPEPGEYATLLLGLGLLGFVARRIKQTAA